MIALLAVLAVVVAEALMVYTFAELFAGLYAESEREAVNGITFAAVALIGYGHIRFAAWYGFEGAARVAWLTVVPFVALYGALRLEFAGDFALWNFNWAVDFIISGDRSVGSGGTAFIALLLMIPLWVREVLRAGDDTDLEVLPKRLGLPFAIVTIVLMIGAGTERGPEVARAGAAFYSVGLIALCSSQLALSGVNIGGLKAGEVTGVLLAGVFLAVAAAVVALSLIFGVLAPVVGPILADAITLTLTVTLFPIAWSFDKILSLLLPGGSGSIGQLPDFASDDARPGNGGEQDDSGRIAFLKFVVRGFAVVVLLGVIAGVVSLVSRFRRPLLVSEESVEKTTAGSLDEDMPGWFRSLFQGSPRGPRRRRRDGILALYDDVLTGSEAKGFTRHSSSTPREFAPVLGEAFEFEVTSDITAAFEAAYYGSREVDDGEIEELRVRWSQSRAR